MAGFRELRGVNVKVLFANPEKAHQIWHIHARNRVVWRITRENRFRRLGCRPLEGLKKEAEQTF